MQHGALSLRSLLAATSQFGVLIGQKMQLTGWHNGNEMRNAICLDTQTSIEWPCYHSPYCDGIINLPYNRRFLIHRIFISFTFLPKGVLLEQNLLLNRKNELTDDSLVNEHKRAKDSCIFICTTMYHEADYEMEQLLLSIRRVDIAREKSMRRIESHVWFDGAVKRNVLNR